MKDTSIPFDSVITPPSSRPSLTSMILIPLPNSSTYTHFIRIFHYQYNCTPSPWIYTCSVYLSLSPWCPILLWKKLRSHVHVASQSCNIVWKIRQLKTHLVPCCICPTSVVKVFHTGVATASLFFSLYCTAELIFVFFCVLCKYLSCLSLTLCHYCMRAFVVSVCIN